MHKALKAHVLDERHKFKTATMELPMQNRCQILPMDSYVAKPKNSSMNFNGIASYKQQSPCFSPKAENNATPVADLYCLRECYRPNARLSVPTDLKSNRPRTDGAFR